MKTMITKTIFAEKPLPYVKHHRGWLLIAASMLLLNGCALASKTPSVELQAAERAISNAELAQVTRYSSTELNTARTELTAARAAVIEKDMPQAQRLARQAQLSAELALANAELIKATAVNKDMQQSIDALQQEAQRNISKGTL